MADSQNDDPGGYGLDDSERSSGGSGSGSSVGGKSGGGGGEPIPRDDFVRKLVRDPARVHEEERLLLLSGFIGDSDEEGYTRIYCEPTLDCFADVRDEDIVHHQESDGGGPGRMVWARFGAQVRQGRRGQGKRPESSFLAGPLMQDYGGGGGGGGAAGLQAAGGQLGQAPQIGQVPQVAQVTGHIWCTWICPTRVPLMCSIVCPTQVFHLCPTNICQLGGGEQIRAAAAPAAGGGAIGQTGWYGCDPTAATHCFICPPITSDPRQCAVAAAPQGGQVGPTGWLGCTHAIGCPGTSTCPPQGGQGGAGGQVGPTGFVDCTQALGCPGTSTCPPQTHMLGCPGTSTCPPQTHMLGCPRTSTCPPTYTPGCGGGGEMMAGQAGGGGAAGAQSSIATVCTQVGCQQQQGTIATVCTQVGCQHQSTVATICTQIGCQTYNYGCTLGFTCTYVSCGSPQM